MNYIASIFCTFIICHSPQKSSVVQKVYKPALCSSARPFAPYSSLGQAVGSGPACQGLPFGELAGASPTERARMLPNSSAQRSYRSDNEPAYRCAAALGRQALPSPSRLWRATSQRERLWRTGKRKSPLGGSDSEGVFPFGVTILTLDIPDFSISDFPQKSSAVQKVYSHSSLGIYCIFLSKFMI